ncbi:MAG: LPS export ABC transporter periplasmic protein LptC [Pseudomonadota bacterium]
MNAHDAKMHDLARGPVANTASGRAEVSARADDQRKFADARRYTRQVRRLKIGLPVLGGGLIVLFIVLAIAGQLIATPFGPATIDLTKGTVVMDKPSVSGFTASNSTYEIVATRALQDLKNPKTVSLEEIGATLTLEDGNIASIAAGAGKFNVESEQLELSEGVRMHMSSGYRAELDQAEIDVKGGVLKSEGQVMIEAAIGDIQANRLEVRDNGEYILFDERVRMVIRPEHIRQ